MNISREQVKQALDKAVTLSRQHIPANPNHPNPNYYADQLVQDLVKDLLFERRDEDQPR